MLTNKIFSQQILSSNFKMESSLNRGLVWKFLGWRLIILIDFFLQNYNSLNSAAILSPGKTAVRYVGVKNSKVDWSQYFKTNIFSYFEEKNISSIQFNGEIINMTFPTRYLALSVGYSLLWHNLILKSPSNFFGLDLKISISFFFYIEWNFICI